MSSTDKKYEIDMCNGPILGKMLMFAVPLMCSSMLQLLFNAADIVVVGRFAGENSMAAVGSNTALINLLTNLFVGLSIGANVLVARCFGGRDEKELKKSVHTAITLSIYSGIFLLIIGVIFAKQILILMNTPTDVLPLATVYLRIYFLGMPATMIYNFGSAILRAVGDTKRPLYFLFGAGVVNVILNLIFVVLLNMDVSGVAVATVVSECISAALVLRCLMREKGGIRLYPKELKMDKTTFVRILKIGLPAGFQGIVFALSNVVIQSSINGFGGTVVAGKSAAANIEGFVYFGMNAFYQAAISFTSQNMGAGKYKRINKILFVSQACVITVGIIMGTGALVFGRQLLSIYSSKVDVIDAGIDRLRVIARTYALCGIMDVMVGMLRGIGYSIMPMIVSLIGACGLRLLWLATVFQIPKYHTIGIVYASYPITWIITFGVHILCYAIIWHKLKKKLLNRQVMNQI